MYSSEPSSIAKLGFINLIPAMRLMDNFKTISYTQVLDESGSGCFSCPHFASCKLHTSDHCIRCLKKKYKLDETVKYVNEKNLLQKRQKRFTAQNVPYGITFIY